jgi:hypothetical protein
VTSPGQWPYPSYADRRWLGGDRGEDPALVAVVRAVRALVAGSGGPAGADPPGLLHALGRIADLGERAEWAMLSLIGEARCQGVTWQAIGEALGVTKQAAQQRFAPYVQQALDRAAPDSADAP